MLLGERGERSPVMGEQRLVGRNHMLASTERGLDCVLCRPLLSADQLDKVRAPETDLERMRREEAAKLPPPPPPQA